MTLTTKFRINGREFAVDLALLPADISLNTFIREHAGFPATKFMCQEGGCGVCVCAVTGKHPATGEVRTWAVNSCLTLLNTCADWEITTSEGLGDKRNGYHPIQKRLAKLNGTQCGYCSPGFVMNMYALLESKQGKVTMEEVENSFGGNICRCTGYRPILDAMKSFAVDSNIELPAECLDIEDLSVKTCPKTGDRCSGTCKGGDNEQRTALKLNDGSAWYWPKSIAELFEVFEQIGNEKYMLVAGNTAHGVYRRPADIRTFIDVNAIPELHQHDIGEDALVLGGNLSLAETMDIFKEAAQKPGYEYCRQLWNHFDLIANVPVRNMGTLAGNLSIKHQHKEFPSDVFVAFEALNVKVVVLENGAAGKTCSLAEYFSTPMAKKLIHSFVLKAYPRDQYVFESYKIMPRAQNAHAYVNAAFFVKVQPADNTVLEANICFGGIHADYVHAKPIEELLVGKNLFDEQVVAQVFGGLQSHLKATVSAPDASPEYREKLAQGLLYKFLLGHAPKRQIGARLVSGGAILHRDVSSGKQTFEKKEKDFPVGQATVKYEGYTQTAGEAMFSNDLPTQAQQVWVAFVTAKRVGATVTNIDASEALQLPGVVTFLGAQDIPGTNTIVPKDLFFDNEEDLFVTGPVRFCDQPVGIIVAESNDLAHRAAKLVKLTYEGGTDKVLATMEDCLNTASSGRVQHNIKSVINELKITDQYDLVASGRIEMGLQYHFFLEPHSTVVVPNDDGLLVYSACQWMDVVQIVVSKLLNMKNNEIHVKTRRVGGGYGGKGTRPAIAACAAALAAYKLRRPARCVMSLESMMTQIGKRWPCDVDYQFHVKKNGKIVALRSTFHQDAGYLTNESPMQHTVLVSKNVYEFSDNYKLDGYMVLTDSPNNTAFRGPGSVEGTAMIENILEHIAFETGLDPVKVREANVLPGHKIRKMLPYFLEKAEYERRKAEVLAFNKENRWRKKGLGFIIGEYHIGFFGQFAATVAIYRGDGTVIITHGGIEMGQGMNTKVAQVAAHLLGIPLDMIRFEASNTVNGANTMVTGGSIGSEAICVAVRRCCNTLNERLQPIKESLKGADWQGIITEAYNKQVNLIVSDQFQTVDLNPYTVCGLCLTEVEVDILTGNYVITRVDLLEDAGESLNPNVDVGQVEGAFIMGLGYWTTEQIVVSHETGEILTTRSWNYKPPGVKDIPVDFRIELLPQSPHPTGFMSSKATGEPACCLAVVVVFALQHALQSARDDAGLPRKWVTLSAPMTPEHVLLNAGTNISQFKLK